jgi:hypothetical protein
MMACSVGKCWPRRRSRRLTCLSSAPAADAVADVGQACEVLRGVLTVIGSLTSMRALDLVSAVRGRLAGYPRVTAVQELERDLDQCTVGAGL